MCELEGIGEPSCCPRWLGHFVGRPGGDKVRIPCRGSWNDLEHWDDDSLCFTITHAWRHPEYLEDLIRSKFDKLNIYYQEQELDGGIFTSNDLQGEHYPETVLLDAGGNIDYFVGEVVFAVFSKISGQTILQWGQEGFLGSGGCVYGSPDGGKDRLLSAVGHIPAEDIEGIYLTWDGGYVKTKALPKGKYLCTVNIYKQ